MTAARKLAAAVCPACAPHPAHAPDDCEVHCGCEAESRPGKSAFVIRGHCGPKKDYGYFRGMTGIGPRFGGTLKQAVRLKTNADVAATITPWPMTVLYKVESVPLEEPSSPAPVLKWAGGKRQLITELRKSIPEDFFDEHHGHHYYEPFIGGGALFFDLRASGWNGAATLGDANSRLIRTYLGLKLDVEMVIEILKKRRYEKAQFLRERARKIDGSCDEEVAAWMIYLNRTCFNGLYRVNKSGEFNVPFGDYTNPTICDVEGLRAASQALASTKLVTGDFEKVVKSAEAEDLVYFDPPYVPVSKTSDFTGYTVGKFGPPDQERLRDCALRLKKLGAHVILSNADTPVARKLYSGKDFNIRSVSARRNINSKAAKRGAVGELIIT